MQTHICSAEHQNCVMSVSPKDSLCLHSVLHRNIRTFVWLLFTNLDTTVTLVVFPTRTHTLVWQWHDTGLSDVELSVSCTIWCWTAWYYNVWQWTVWYWSIVWIPNCPTLDCTASCSVTVDTVDYFCLILCVQRCSLTPYSLLL